MQPKSGDVYMMDVYTSNGKSMTDYCYKLGSYLFFAKHFKVHKLLNLELNYLAVPCNFISNNEIVLAKYLIASSQFLFVAL